MQCTPAQLRLDPFVLAWMLFIAARSCRFLIVLAYGAERHAKDEKTKKTVS